LIEMILPSSVKVLGELCFSECKSLSSVRCESGSRLLEIEREVLRHGGWTGRGGRGGRAGRVVRPRVGKAK
jgi:hypothetical protein